MLAIAYSRLLLLLHGVLRGVVVVEGGSSTQLMLQTKKHAFKWEGICDKAAVDLDLTLRYAGVSFFMCLFVTSERASTTTGFFHQMVCSSNSWRLSISVATRIVFGVKNQSGVSVSGDKQADQRLLHETAVSSRCCIIPNYQAVCPRY